MTAGIPAASIKLKRAYEAVDTADGARVLVDRLWPRGVSKEDAALDQWMKEIAPTTELRKWFGHDPARWEEFRSRYSEELHQNTELLGQLRSLARQGPLTLVYSAHDEPQRRRRAPGCSFGPEVEELTGDAQADHSCDCLRGTVRPIVRDFEE